jgi:hypothetical protein
MAYSSRCTPPGPVAQATSTWSTAPCAWLSRCPHRRRTGGDEYAHLAAQLTLTRQRFETMKASLSRSAGARADVERLFAVGVVGVIFGRGGGSPAAFAHRRHTRHHRRLPPLQRSLQHHRAHGAEGVVQLPGAR